MKKLFSAPKSGIGLRVIHGDDTLTKFLFDAFVARNFYHVRGRKAFKASQYAYCKLFFIQLLTDKGVLPSKSGSVLVILL